MYLAGFIRTHDLAGKIIGLSRPRHKLSANGIYKREHERKHALNIDFDMTRKTIISKKK